jgi:uncharacterized protein YjbI with pentapeptide repeats
MSTEESVHILNRKLWIFGMIGLGCVLATGLLFLFRKMCPELNSGYCKGISDNPPWLLVTGLTLGPATVLFWIWRDRYRWNDIKNARANLEVADKGQVTDRFSKAIEHIGTQIPAVRLGGIYALEKVASDYPDDYMSTVIETLSAFVRVKTKDGPTSEDESGEKIPDVDVQAAITVLGRLKNETKTRIDLSKAHLQGSRLNGANFVAANFVLVHLEGAFLQEADFREAALMEAHLQGANMQGANLQGANLQGAHLRQANLQGANLQGAYLRQAHLEKARLLGAHLEGALLHGANLQGANLEGALLHGAGLSDANLEAEVSGAFYDSKTSFQEGFLPEEQGMVKTDGGSKPAESGQSTE